MSGRVAHVQTGLVSAETSFPSEPGYLGGGILRRESPTDQQA